MTDADRGGDPACWAHVVGEDPRGDLRGGADLELLVRSFYRQAAADDLLGPVFAAAEVDWAAHIPKLVDFWAWQLFGERGYEGNPLLAHRPAHAATPFRPEHFARWLELFEDTVDEWFTGPVADAAKLKAAKMARALERLLAGVESRGDAPISVPVVRPPAPRL
ncbi:MAG: group III truncated hemoglobin [Acidimicrobiales bacterium]|nr:group III truncated hemoglobin [Acidimicrobiales bacterium]MCB9371557.1 group III truncated hemoglobin [Microthrixaceae bacterium]